MSQASLVLPTTGTHGGLELVQAINAALAALASQNAGPAAPSPTNPFMLWPDTTVGVLKLRNAADTAWITLGSLSAVTGTGAWVLANSPALEAPALGTPTSGILSNCTGLPVSGVSGLAAFVAAFLVSPTLTGTVSVTGKISLPNGSSGTLEVQGVLSSNVAGPVDIAIQDYSAGFVIVNAYHANGQSSWHVPYGKRGGNLALGAVTSALVLTGSEPISGVSVSSGSLRVACVNGSGNYLRYGIWSTEIN